MGLLSYNRLCELVERGVINAPMENVNAASIDITLHDEILIESTSAYFNVDLMRRKSVTTTNCNIHTNYQMRPGEFILASSREIFNLPNNIAAEYKLKSSLARNGLQHLLAGWCDPGWTNSRLTLELKNVTQHHCLTLTPGMKIGQMVFWECEPVPEGAAYDKRGQYNNQASVTAAKGLR
jgi:dCTP deaminase